MKKVEYLPKDGLVCEKCYFENICPYGYVCETYLRISEEMDENEEYWDYVCNGDSTEKVR